MDTTIKIDVNDRNDRDYTTSFGGVIGTDGIYRPTEPEDIYRLKESEDKEKEDDDTTIESDYDIIKPDCDKVIAFIPVRGGSKSIPMKNIKEFCGKPLVYWVIDALQKCDAVTDIVVATDSGEIETCVDDKPDCSKVTIYRRSAATATDTASTESAILEYLKSEDYGRDFGELGNPVFMLVQATSPLTRAEDFSKGISLLRLGNVNSVVSGVNTKRFHWGYQYDDIFYADYDVESRPRRQDYGGSYIENGAFYISTKDAILQCGHRLPFPTTVCPMPNDTLLEIDEPSDWVEMERLMYKRTKGKFPMPLAFVFDVDGTLTDGGHYYTETGKVFKKFNAKDGHAIARICELGVPVIFLSGEDSDISKQRAKDLGVTFVSTLKHKDKTDALLKEKALAPEDICYVGDDVLDMGLLYKAKYAFCPSDAANKVKNVPDIIELKSRGGEGVVSEILEYFV